MSECECEGEGECEGEVVVEVEGEVGWEERRERGEGKERGGE